MRKPIFIGVLLLAFGTNVQAQAPATDIQAIKQFCGCFEVDFRYRETFSDQPDYPFREPYHETALEWVFPVEETPGKIVLQHVLILNDTTYLKHWRQDWVWEPQSRFTYLGNQVWRVVPVAASEAKGKWSQAVFEVNDTPRYSGVAAWVTIDGNPVWENTSDAPLPRREYSKRDDYQIMRRTNSNAILPTGWVHDQDNKKVVLAEEAHYVLAEEKGRNTYTRTDEGRCTVAADWWQQKAWFWTQVRTVWDAQLASTDGFALKDTPGGKALRKDLNTLEKQTFKNEKAAQTAIRETLQKYGVTFGR